MKFCNSYLFSGNQKNTCNHAFYSSIEKTSANYHETVFLNPANITVKNQIKKTLNMLRTTLQTVRTQLYQRTHGQIDVANTSNGDDDLRSTSFNTAQWLSQKILLPLHMNPHPHEQIRYFVSLMGAGSK